MATDRQITANQRNARRSTGPRTKAGKARSRYNALKNGLTARTAVPLLGESRQEFEELRYGLFADFQPKTVVARELVDELAQRLWQLRRCRNFANAIADVAARQKLANVTEGVQDEAKRMTSNDGGGAMAPQLSGLEAALYDPGLVSSGLQVTAADHMFEFASMAEIEGHQTRLLTQIQRLIDEIERVESRYAKNVVGREAQSEMSGTGGDAANEACEFAALAEDRDVEAFQAIVDILADPAAPEHVRASIAEKLLQRGNGKPAPSTEVTPEAQPTLAEEFEHYVRRLNDPNDREMQELQERSVRNGPDVDFSDLDH